MPSLRNFERAIVDEHKLVSYALDEQNPRGRDKARVFGKVLGYTKENWQALKDAIVTGIADADAESLGSSDYGEVWRVDLTLIGPSGRTAVVRTTWQYDKQSNGSLRENPRLVTAFVRRADGR
jgi:filamentous hemagglutinin